MAMLAENKTQTTVSQIDSRLKSDVTIRTPEPRDFTEIISFLRRNFFLDEPLNISIGLTKGDPTSTILEGHCIETLHKGLSFVAEIDGQLAGVIINSIIHRDTSEDVTSEQPPNPPEPLKFSDSADTKFLAIENLMGVVAASIKLFQRYPTIDKIFDVEILSVEKTLQGRGIAKKLLEACRNLSLNRKIPLIRCMCSSHYSALAVQKLGYQCIYKIAYTDYKDKNGKPVFSPDSPHTCMSAYIYPLNI